MESRNTSRQKGTKGRGEKGRLEEMEEKEWKGVENGRTDGKGECRRQLKTRNECRTSSRVSKPFPKHPLRRPPPAEAT